MTFASRVLCCFVIGGSLFAARAPLAGNQSYSEMRWRLIGPFRGGRTAAICGVPQQSNVFYMAATDGGIWKSTDYGRTWKPIFDGQDTGSIGALAVAPSDPNIVYAGSGEGLQRPDLSVGDGIYRSADAGKSWQHLGLRNGQQIPSLTIDPQDPNRLFVAVLGHPYGPNSERGVYRSTNGGRSFERVLYKDENTGAVQVSFDPKNSQTVYAAMWSARQAPWEIGGSFNGASSGLFKSVDGGSSWKQLTQGLPTIAQGLGRIGFAISPSHPQRMYALIDASPSYGGLFRSDDAGSSWQRINHEERIWGRGGDFAGVEVDPRDENKIYVANTSTYRSTDAGKNFVAIKGAPGGDDYHSIWINPTNPDILFLGVDQGATISVNGGDTWSSWYNQPTAQFYHVITDNRFPYWVYGAQQESGSAAVESRSDDGSISFRNFHPVGVEEYGYVAPDPLNPDLIYGGKATRFSWTTQDVQDISPQLLRGKYRFVRTMPLLFSPIDPHILYLGSNVLFKTTNGGDSWDVISPDLTRAEWAMPAVIQPFESADPEHGKHHGVIYTIAPSPREANLIWAGTDDGLIHRTQDGGKTWQDVTPAALTPWSKVSLIEASHYDASMAFAAVNRFRLDDLNPHVYRTRDSGQSWQEITNGLPNGAVVNAVREDPLQGGLLYAATETGVFVSFNNGDSWKSLRLNLPVTSVRDLTVHQDDLVIGTHGRSFWILDDITPLRQYKAATAASSAFLYAPQTALRWRSNRNTDTPLPPEEPAGRNPPDGAIIDYILPTGGTSVTLEIFDSAKQLVRRYSSDDKSSYNEAALQKELNVPTYWVQTPSTLSAATGMHRFVWDLRYPPPDSLEHEYPIAATYQATPREPRGALVLPGQYTVRLTVAGQTYTQPLTVVMDPRIKTAISDLEQQLALSRRLTDLMQQDAHAIAQMKEANASDSRRSALEKLNGNLARMFAVIQGSDNKPTREAIAEVDLLAAALKKQLSK